MITTSQVSFTTLSDLRSSTGTDNCNVLLNGLTSLTDGNGGTYTWNSSSTGIDDGFTIIQPSGITTGRWLRLTNSNVLKGSQTFNGTGLQTSFTVSYGQTLPITPAGILTQPLSSNAAALSWVNNITNTGFTINFISAPILGTSNISIFYLIIKQ